MKIRNWWSLFLITFSNFSCLFSFTESCWWCSAVNTTKKQQWQLPQWSYLGCLALTGRGTLILAHWCMHEQHFNDAFKHLFYEQTICKLKNNLWLSVRIHSDSERSFSKNVSILPDWHTVQILFKCFARTSFDSLWYCCLDLCKSGCSDSPQISYRG